MRIDKEPFIGSAAVRAGLVTWAMLRGPRFQRLFPDVYLSADLPADLTNRSRGALLLAPGHGVLSGYSAAALLGATCAAVDADADLTVGGCGLRPRPGLRLHREVLADDEVVSAGDVPVTSPLRTAWDLARWENTVEAVVALDALARAGGFDPRQVMRIQQRYPRARWRRRVSGIVELADPRAESPMETRSRLVLVLRGLPKPDLQHCIYDDSGNFVARVDMAYKDLKLAMEYDGRGHLDRLAPDAHRGNAIEAIGWAHLRFTSIDVFATPNATADRVRDVRAVRARQLRHR